MLRSFNATIDAEITENKLSAKLIQRDYGAIKKQLEDSAQFALEDQDSSSNMSGANTSNI